MHRSPAKSFQDLVVLRIAVVDDGVDEPQGIGTFEPMTNLLFENQMIQTGEVFADVALQDVAARSRKLHRPSQRVVGAVAHTVGVGVIDE